MAYIYPVKWITSEMRGAPVLSGTAGTLIALLDAFLLTGWGAATAISVEVLDGVGTAIFNAGITFTQHAVVSISGATPAALNGEARVLTSASDRITFATDAPNGTATGSIVFKFAPVGGWEKAFSGTAKAVYRSTDAQSAKHCLRVDDTGTTTARVRGYESMSDVDTGVGPFPTETQFSGGGYWWKSLTANGTARGYAFAADRRMLLCAPRPEGAGTALSSNIRGFGDPIALAPSGDTWATVLSYAGASSATGFEPGSLSGSSTTSASSGGAVFPRAFSGLGSAALCRPVNEAGTPYEISGRHSNSGLGPGPSSIDGQIKLARSMMAEQAIYSAPRCAIPGVLIVPQLVADGQFLPGSVIDGSGALAGRKLLSVLTSTNAAVASGLGVAFIDITGPWR